MVYTIVFKPQATKDLKRMSTDHASRVVARIEAMSIDLHGDVKRLTDFTPEYRLRVGEYRVLFEIEKGTIVIYRVLHRSHAYR